MYVIYKSSKRALDAKLQLAKSVASNTDIPEEILEQKLTFPLYK